jgi:hypothetical protein
VIRKDKMTMAGIDADSDLCPVLIVIVDREEEMVRSRRSLIYGFRSLFPVLGRLGSDLLSQVFVT